MHQRLRIAITLGTFVVAAIVGCGKHTDDDSDSAPQAEAPAPTPVQTAISQPALPPVRLEQKTPDALVRRARDLLNAKPPNYVALLDLCQWQTPLQQAWQPYLQNQLLPAVEFKNAVESRFPMQFDLIELPYQRIRIADVALTKNKGDEAEAKVLFDGKTQTLYLIRVFDRWWVSGLTFEKAGAAFLSARNMSTAELKNIGTGNAATARLVREITQRVYKGQFRTGQDASAEYNRVTQTAVRTP